MHPYIILSAAIGYNFQLLMYIGMVMWDGGILYFTCLLHMCGGSYPIQSLIPYTIPCLVYFVWLYHPYIFLISLEIFFLALLVRDLCTRAVYCIDGTGSVFN